MDRKADDIIKSKKQFVHFNDQLTDSESIEAVQVIGEAQMKWASKHNSKENLEALRDEVLTKLMEINILAEFDVAPCFHGEPPIVEFIGKIAGDGLHKYGFDHEKKKWEIDRAHDRGEDYLGEKESLKSRKE